MGLLLLGEELPDFGIDNDAHVVIDEDTTQEGERSNKTVSFFSFFY